MLITICVPLEPMEKKAFYEAPEWRLLWFKDEILNASGWDPEDFDESTTDDDSDSWGN